MSIDYLAGVQTSIIIAAFPCLLLITLIFLGLIKYRNELQKYKLILLFIFSCIISPPLILTCLAPIIYVPINLLHQNIFSFDFYRNEFSTGVIGLRIASLIVGFQALKNLYSGIRSSIFLTKSRKNKGLNIDEARNIEINLSEEDKKLWIDVDVFITIFLQYSYYLICIFYLWLYVIKNVANLGTTFAHWCLFFICDDWGVIADYIAKYKKPMLSMHLLRIVLFNTLLLGSIVAVAGVTFNWISVSFIALELIAFTLPLYVYQWRLKMFNEEL